MRILGLLLFVSLSTFSFGQHTFFKFYSGGGDDYAHGVVELNDNTFAITGNSSSFWVGEGQAFIVKIDAEGNYVWSNHYGGSESEGGKKILYKEDDGFYVAGYTNSIGNGGFDFYLFKTDLDGNLLWEKSYGGNGWERVYDAHLTRDGGVLMIGETSSNANFNQDMWFVKTNADGDTVWTKTIGSDLGLDIAKAMYPLTDSSFVIVGDSYSQDSSAVKVRALEIFDNGDLGWDTTNLGPYGNTYANDAIVKNDLLYTVGYSDVYSESMTVNYFSILNLTDFSGFDYNEATSGFKRAKTICPSSDPSANYIVYEYFAPSLPQYAYDFSIAKFNNGYGFVSDLQPISFHDQDFANETIPTSDGGTLTVGSSDGDINVGDKHSFALKTLPNDSVLGWPTFPDITQIADIEEINQLKENTSVFPNPTKNIVTVEVGFSGEFEYAVLDINGRELIKAKSQGETQIDVSSFGAGIYFVRLNQNDVSADFKLVKE